VRQDGVSAELLEVLLDESMEGNRRWQALSRRLLASTLTGSDVYELFQAILHYDETFAASVERPVSMPTDAVIVSGSGKEMFKTFNVSTAAATIAAAAGTPVIKGASRSVSATSGALDVLRQLGICVVERPGDIGASLKRHGIAFVETSSRYLAVSSVAPARSDAWSSSTPFWTRRGLGPCVDPSGARFVPSRRWSPGAGSRATRFSS
jgi:anthranilate phosphoribosyltransferase